VWVHTEPVRGAYARIVKRTRRHTLVPARLPGVAISIADMFALR
jgi:hypothetical protein